MNEIKAMHHIAIRVNKFDKTVQFYTEIMGFKQIYAWSEEPERATMFDTGNGTKLEFFEKTDETYQEGQISHFAFDVEDSDKVFARIVESGSLVKMEPTDIEIDGEPGFKARIAFVYGPSGEIIELFQTL